MASGLKTEKNPNTCEELKIVASSKSIKFWSAPPPRTLNPEAPSPAFVTPGSNKIDFKTSTSPKTTGIFFMVAIESLFTLISAFWVFVVFFSVTITSSNSSLLSVKEIL